MLFSYEALVNSVIVKVYGRCDSFVWMRDCVIINVKDYDLKILMMNIDNKEDYKFVCNQFLKSKQTQCIRFCALAVIAVGLTVSFLHFSWLLIACGIFACSMNMVYIYLLRKNIKKGIFGVRSKESKELAKFVSKHEVKLTRHLKNEQ